MVEDENGHPPRVRQKTTQRQNFSLAEQSRNYDHIKDNKDINANFKTELESFFKFYTAMENKEFDITGIRNAGHAIKLIKKANYLFHQ